MNRVMNQPLPGPASARASSTPAISPGQNAGRLFRKCSCGGDHAGECDECKKAKLRKSRSDSAPSTAGVPAVVNEVLRRSGAPLGSTERAWMETRFGHDFSRVRVHDDAHAAESAEAVNARAYTVGSHVVFGAGEYRPGSDAGRKLLAHELAHVVQQSSEQPARNAGAPGLQTAAATAIGGEHDPEEIEADAAAERVTQGIAVHGAPARLGESLQKQHLLQRVVRAAAPPAAAMAFSPAVPAPARTSSGGVRVARAIALPADAGSDPRQPLGFLGAGNAGVLRRQTCGDQGAFTQTAHGPCDAKARGLEPCCTQSMLNEIRALRERACPLVVQALASLAQPDQVADKLRAYFNIEPTDTASVDAVRAGLTAMLDFLKRGDVQFYCWDACDSMCKHGRLRAESSPEAGLSQHLIALCGDYEGAVQQGRPYLPQADGDGGVFCGLPVADRMTPHNWTRTLIHEYAHVSSRVHPIRGGMLATCEPGSSNCTPEFSAISPQSPRESALLLRNPDSYAHFVWAVQQGASWQSNVPGQAGGSSDSGLAIGIGIGIGLAVAAGIAVGVYFATRDE